MDDVSRVCWLAGPPRPFSQRSLCGFPTPAFLSACRCPPTKCTSITPTAQGSYNGYPVLPGYWGSYCLDGLAMALWGLYHSNSFEEAIIRVVNFLGDADSTGAVVGQMAGALYGYRGIKAGPPDRKVCGELPARQGGSHAMLSSGD